MKEEIRQGYTRVTEPLSRYTSLDVVDPEILRRACERGTAVHDYIESYLKGYAFESPSDLVRPYFDSFKQWYDSAINCVYAIEKRYYCDTLMITGQVDLIAKLKGDSAFTIIDFKTPVSKGLTWQLQTAAYMQLATKSESIEIKRRGCLHLSKHGSSAVFHEYSNHKDDLQLYISALNLYRFFGR